MEKLKVDSELLKELVTAAYKTAFRHRGSDHEPYVLGQLEATANMAYVLAAGNGNDELELLCQQLALDALDRFTDICGEVRPGSPRSNLTSSP
ncbi:MAG: hypothetical protein SV765_04005 [Pseudomonadota bacterium]|nr:hypothetical protein [Pseudomonadota bacterium]